MWSIARVSKLETAREGCNGIENFVVVQRVRCRVAGCNYPEIYMGVRSDVGIGCPAYRLALSRLFSSGTPLSLPLIQFLT